MKLRELIEFCANVPDETEIAVLRCSDMIENGGMGIDRIEYHLTSDFDNPDGIIFLRLE